MGTDLLSTTIRALENGERVIHLTESELAILLLGSFALGFMLGGPLISISYNRRN